MAWFHPVFFTLCGLATLARAFAGARERSPWALLGAGLTLYGLGSVAYAVRFGDGTAGSFPTVSDALWLSLYPFALAGIVALVREQRRRTPFVLWLDGAIAGAVVASVAAAVWFGAMFADGHEDTLTNLARLGYPLGDIAATGLTVAIAASAGRRMNTTWLQLSLAFGFLAWADGTYVVEAAEGAWSPGGLRNLLYPLATLLIATAAWTPRPPARESTARPRRWFPLAVAALALPVIGLGVALDLNPLARVLVLATATLFVLRFATTLYRLDEQRAALADLAAHDPLTGIANHRTLHARLAEEIERARRSGSALSLVALDIDHFKAINDTYGHAEGDATLKAIAQVVRSQLRQYDLVGRVGGEEFALVLPGADEEHAFEVAERCRLALLDLEVAAAPISCSAGVATWSPGGDDIEQLAERADTALYAAKESGRGHVRRYDAAGMVLLSSAEQHRQIRGLLERPDAVTIAVQPLVELATGRIAGYEALARFRDVEPVRGPDEWFDQARRVGLGPALEARAIERALAVAGRPDGTFLTVNVSPTALLSREVASVLPHDLSGIVVEVTEGELFAAGAGLEDELDRLRSRGARIAVDDAGAGYAGLSQLVRVKPDILKLDRSLVSGVHADGAKAALLGALSRFAISTGAAVCAEGVEELDELIALAKLDITYAQGYALARPAAPWPAIDAELADVVAAPTSSGMRLAPAAAAESSAVSLGDVTEALAGVSSPATLLAAMPLVTRFAGADEVAISRVLDDEACVQTLSYHDWGVTGERYALSDYPATERVVREHLVGQVVAGDPAADPAELEMLAQSGRAAVLMAPVVHRGRTVGLVELYRNEARPWTATEIDHVRMLAHHLGPTIVGLEPAAA